MPPYDLIFASYALHSPIRSLAFPLRMFTCEGGMSTADAKNAQHVREGGLRRRGGTHRARRTRGT